MAKRQTGDIPLPFETAIPQMPEGYYSGDKPNPNLRAFVEQHLQERPYTPETDDYDVPAFDKPIETTKATAIYNMHTYWSKKPHDAIRQYIRHYTRPGDLVLDPFCGSGGTALAALMEGRKAIAIDRSPAATFITKNYCTPVDVDELQQAFEELQRKVKPEIDWLYETRCDRCDGRATTAYTVYSQVFQCPRCLEKVPLFDCPEAEATTAKGKPKKIKACPHCYQRDIVEEISTRTEKFGAKPVLVSYLCNSGCKPARSERRHNDSDEKKRDYFEKYDLGKIREIDEGEIPYWYPRDRMMHVESDTEPWGDEWRPGRNFRTVAELFTKRNLWSLTIYILEIKGLSFCKDQLLFMFTSILLKSSRMMAHNSDGIGRIQKGTYYIPQIFHDINVNRFMQESSADMASGYKKLILNQHELMITTSDVRDIQIPASSVDYIFTDPPYAEKVQYGELNFVWEAWLGLDTHWHNDEIVINETRGKTEDDWSYMMQQALAECFRVLKPGRCISLCYHDTSEGTWAFIQDVMAQIGFIVENTKQALFINSATKTTNQYFADKVNKRDLVINFRKPKPGEAAAPLAITGTEDKTTFNEKVHQIIRDYLGANPGSTKDRIYDDVVSRMVRSGQMEAHDFDELLHQVAVEGKSERTNGREAERWYLKDTELDIQDETESAKEDAAARVLADVMIRRLKESYPNITIAFSPFNVALCPDQPEGLHYSDFFEHYIYAVKDKPRRQLAEFLPDYFYKTESGTWRLPESEDEERAKREARNRSLGRRVKRYIAQLDQGMIIPDHERPSDATLAEWIRHCKRAGLHEQGRLLYEKGGLNPDNLPEEAMVNVEEDYQVCVRMLMRGEGKGGKGKGERRKGEG